FRAAGCAAKSPHKTLHRIDVTLDRDRIDLRIEGDAFLRKMVRIIAGTLAEVGAGLRPSDELVDVLAARDRRRAGLTAPAKGLRLERVALAGPDPLRRIWPAAAGLERLPTEGPPTT